MSRSDGTCWNGTYEAQHFASQCAQRDPYSNKFAGGCSRHDNRQLRELVGVSVNVSVVACRRGGEQNMNVDVSMFHTKREQALGVDERDRECRREHREDVSFDVSVNVSMRRTLKYF